jgi:hypothetical protein
MRAFGLKLLLFVMLVPQIFISNSIQASTNPYFGIRIVDRDTHEGVPLVQLRTSNYIVNYSDSQGYVAFFEPGMMDHDVWFSVLTDGYTFSDDRTCKPSITHPCDSGIILHTTPGKIITLTVERKQLAERVFRLTGQGIYRDSVLLNIPTPINESSMEMVAPIGQDTLMLTKYKGLNYWFFGDTVCAPSARQENCNGYGQHTIAATSIDQANQAPVLQYFTSNINGMQWPKPVTPVGDLNMNTWTAAPFVINAGTPQEAMYAFYLKPYSTSADPSPDKTGLVKWNESKQQFELLIEWPLNNGMEWLSNGHVVSAFAPGEGVDGYVYFAGSFVLVRAPKNKIAQLSAWESLTPLLSGSDMNNPKIDPKGWGWKKGMPVFHQSDETTLIAKGIMPLSQARMQIVDSITKKPVVVDSGVVHWNAFLKKYILVFGNGQLYLAMSDSMTGPWNTAVVIAQHEDTHSSCYNSIQVSALSDATERNIYVACSYTSMWSNDAPAAGIPNVWSTCLFGQNAHQNCAPVVPRYEYNNLVYRLDLLSMK